MTFNKPSDIRYTDMCILIDKTSFDKEYDSNIIFEYIYHIINMLAHKRGFFQHAQEYDQFALYLASIVYMRLVNPKKPRIKSILNYIKRIIGLRKITFNEQFTSSFVDKEIQVYSFSNYDLANYLVDQASTYDNKSFDSCTLSIDDIVVNHLKKIPFKYNSSEWINIYISVLLTLLNSFTPLKSESEKIKNAAKHNKEEILNKTYRNLRNSDPILYHLDPSMKPYIKVLANEVKHAISTQMTNEYNYYISPEETLKNLLSSTYGEQYSNEY